MSRLSKEIQALAQNRENIVNALLARGSKIQLSSPLNIIPEAIRTLPKDDVKEGGFVLDESTYRLSFPNPINKVPTGLYLEYVDTLQDLCQAKFVYISDLGESGVLYEWSNSSKTFSIFSIKKVDTMSGSSAEFMLKSDECVVRSRAGSRSWPAGNYRYKIFYENDKILPEGLKDVNFHDYDGTLLYAYTAQEAMALTELPPIPEESDNITRQEWNYTLEEMKEEVEWQGQCVIGCSAITTDGKTYLYVDLPEDMLNVKSEISQSIENGVEIDWGDGTVEKFLKKVSKVTDIDGSAAGNGALNSTAAVLTHTYSEPGPKVITFNPVNDSVIWCIGGSGGQKLLRANETASTTNTRRRSSCITKLKLGKGLKLIAANAFTYMHIQYVNIPASVTAYAAAMNDTYYLKSLIFPRTIQRYANNYVAGVATLEVLSIPSSFNFSATGTPMVTSAYLKQCCVPKNFPCQKFQMHASNRLIKKYVPNIAANSIASSAQYNSNLEGEFRMPEGVTSCPSFQTAIKLKKVILPSSCTSITASAFNACSSLEEINLDNITTYSGNSTFSDCASLTHLKINGSVTNIPASTFSGCVNIEEIDFSSHTSVPTLASTNVFTNTLATASLKNPKIVVPENLYTAWKSATNWSTYASYIYYKDENGEYKQ